MPLYFSKPVLRHFTHFIDGMSSIGFTGKLTQIHAYSHHPKHRTTLSHFLQKSPWNEGYLQRQCQCYVRRQIDPKQPLFWLFDDTFSKKNKPLSQAQHPTQDCGFHFSHTEGKLVWGHQVLQVMMKLGEQAFPYDFRHFQKEKDESKIKLSVDLIQDLPQATQPTYVLCDSWYTSKALIEAAFGQGRACHRCIKNESHYLSSRHSHAGQTIRDTHHETSNQSRDGRARNRLCVPL